MAILHPQSHAIQASNTLHHSFLTPTRHGESFCHSMTDPSSSLNSHTAPSVQPITESTAVSASGPKSTPIPEDPVEDYTIKCICGNQDDDGNTVYCERCDTWQHTECYYIDDRGYIPNKDELEDIDHFCADCSPRPLDKKGATERQRARREDLDSSERRGKKATSKSHKKKTKIPETNGVLTNGWAHGTDPDGLQDRTSRSPRDHLPPAKRPKTNHRPSNSASVPALSQPTSHPHKRSASSTHSPTKMSAKNNSDANDKNSYNLEFLHLYDDDPGDTSMQTNLFNGLNITTYLSLWTHDVEALREATHGLSHPDVFQRTDQPLSSIPKPELQKEQKVAENFLMDGRHPKWISVTIDAWTQKNSIVGELKGKIGHMRDYIQEPSNRWDYLRHPAPFVFFHKTLPIYIDTRSEGTTCRYLRRSCEPNLFMKTFLENGSEYHFCFMANQDLHPGTELTIGWTLDEHVRTFIAKQERSYDEEEYITDWVSKVLPEFGGCACGSPSSCSLARYSRRSKASSKARNGHSSKQPSLPRASHPMKSQEGSEQDDGRSTSGSKSGSRDMTPADNSTSDLTFASGLEISAREKRKIEAMERNFEQLENDKHQPAPKKKKRNSGGSSVNTPSAGTSVGSCRSIVMLLPADDLEQKQLGHIAASVSQPNTPGLSKPQYADASTSRRKSGSPTAKPSSSVFSGFARPRTANIAKPRKISSLPNTPSIPSPLFRQNYVSTAMQTDPDEEDDWYKPPALSAPAKRPYVSLTKRLLLRSQQDRQRLEHRRRLSLEASLGQDGSRQGPSPSQASCRLDIIGGSQMQPFEDAEMQDADNSQSPGSTHVSAGLGSSNFHLPERPSIAETIKPPPPPWPSTSPQHQAEQQRHVNGFRHADLRVQLPNKSQLAGESASNTPIIETPTSAIPRSPYTLNLGAFPPSFSASSNLVQPSPIKKKVSLSEYFSKRKGSTPNDKHTGGSPEMQQSDSKQLGALNGENKKTAVDDSAIIVTPKREDGDSSTAGESGGPIL